jgi:hypothetical protein
VAWAHAALSRLPTSVAGAPDQETRAALFEAVKGAAEAAEAEAASVASAGGPGSGVSGGGAEASARLCAATVEFGRACRGLRHVDDILEAATGWD